jgi:hypothetical protein
MVENELERQWFETFQDLFSGKEFTVTSHFFNWDTQPPGGIVYHFYIGDRSLNIIYTPKNKHVALIDFPNHAAVTSLYDHPQDRRACVALIELASLVLGHTAPDEEPSKHFTKVSQLQLNHTGQGYDVLVKMD